MNMLSVDMFQLAFVHLTWNLCDQRAALIPPKLHGVVSYTAAAEPIGPRAPEIRVGGHEGDGETGGGNIMVLLHIRDMQFQVGPICLKIVGLFDFF